MTTWEVGMASSGNNYGTWLEGELNIQGVSNGALQCYSNVTVWRMLPERIHLKAYKLSIVQGAERNNCINIPLSHIYGSYSN
jgi:hypothetical protein